MSKKASAQRRHRQAKREDRMDQQRKDRRNRVLIIAAAALAIVLLIVAAFMLLSNDSVDESRPLADIPPADRNDYYSEYPAMEIDTSKEYLATIRTDQGDIQLRLFAEQSPLTVNNFVFLARQGYYDDTTFHRVLEDFMAQAGDPTGTGGGGPGYMFEDETSNGLIFDRPGLLAMAKPNMPDSNGSQFFITYVETPWLDGRHTIFGEMIEGEEVLNSLKLVAPDPTGAAPSVGDVITRIDITEQ